MTRQRLGGALRVPPGCREPGREGTHERVARAQRRHHLNLRCSNLAGGLPAHHRALRSPGHHRDSSAEFAEVHRRRSWIRIAGQQLPLVVGRFDTEHACTGVPAVGRGVLDRRPAGGAQIRVKEDGEAQRRRSVPRPQRQFPLVGADQRVRPEDQRPEVGQRLLQPLAGEEHRLLDPLPGRSGSRASRRGRR